MIIPLTHERTTVRRMPWVTLAIIGLCATLYVADHWVSSPDAEMAETRREQALRFADEHPYLEIDPELVPRELVETYFGNAEPPAGADVAGEQAELDRLTAAYLDSRRAHPLWRGGLVPAHFSIVDVVTYAFHHGGLLHLAFNMLILYLTGPFVEDDWGHPIYAVCYLGAGVFSGGLYALQYSNLESPLIGASGAVAGVMGAFLVQHGRTRIRFLLFLGVMVATFTAPAWVMLPLWFAGELVAALQADIALPGMGGGGIAYWAHVWGFLFGVASAFVVRRTRPETASASTSMGVVRVNPVVRAAQHDIGRGIYPRAWAMLSEELERRPGDEQVVDALWSLAVLLDRTREVVAQAKRLIRSRIAEDRLEAAQSMVGELAAADPSDPDLPALRVALAQALASTEDGEGDAIALLGRVVESPEPLALGLLGKAHRLSHQLGDGELAATTRRLLLDHPDCDEATRAELGGAPPGP